MMESDKKSNLSLLFEIGTEEIPARFLPGLISQLRSLARDFLEGALIGFTEIESYATPRRSCLFIKGLPKRQVGIKKVVFGPPKNIALDEEGNPTKAAVGFAKSQGVPVESLRVEKKGRGEYFVAIIEEEGKAVKEVLPEILKRVLLSIHFPKSMRWGEGDLRFARPIHWVLAVMDGEVLPLEIDGIKSGCRTWGHRFLSPAEVEIKDVDAYMDNLEERFVIVDQEKRKRMIRDDVKKLAEMARGEPVEDEELLETVTFLVECPGAVLCSFSDTYLSLPKELLITVMKDHQKYFALQHSDGNLLNKFVVIGNAGQNNAEVVRKGAERVIKARFEDARFYFEDDLKISLNDRLENLRRVTFHEKLGSLYDKVQRILRIASELSYIVPGISEKVKRAALFCKADLISGVVREFPELQGLMGKWYASHWDEDPEVAEAIYEHYLPMHAGGGLPVTDTGAILSIADRIDNIVTFFSIDLKPTGSEDPFALRRQTMGIISILLDREYQISIEELIDIAMKRLDVPRKGELYQEVLSFFLQRVETLFISEGYSFDTVQSVLARAKSIPLSKVKKILDAIESFKRETHYNETIIALKRAFNILKGKSTGEINKELLRLQDEINLYGETEELSHQLKDLVNREDYLGALQWISRLTHPINSFFENVLVMDKDEEVRQNRLNLLGMIKDIASEFLDISKLQEI